MRYFLICFFLLLASNVYPKEAYVNIEKKEIPVKSEAISVHGAILGQVFDTNSKEFFPSNEEDTYIKTLNKEQLPFSAIRIIVTPITKLVASIKFVVSPEFRWDFNQCVETKNLFLQSAYEKYGGKLSNQNILSTPFKNTPKSAIGFMNIGNVVINTTCDESMEDWKENGWGIFIADQKLFNQALKEKEKLKESAKEKKKRAIDNMLQ